MTASQIYLVSSQSAVCLYFCVSLCQSAVNRAGQNYGESADWSSLIESHLLSKHAVNAAGIGTSPGCLNGRV